METHPRYLHAFNTAVSEIVEPVAKITRKRTCLYVGAWPNGCALIPELRNAGYQITIVEVWLPYVKEVQKLLLPDEKIVHSDIRDFQTDDKFDVVIWWHGPEHMPQKDWERTMEKLDSFATTWCVLAGPWGTYRQGPVDGNPLQEHVSELTHKWFAERGWCVSTTGQPNMPGGEVVAWRKHAAN